MTVFTNYPSPTALTLRVLVACIGVGLFVFSAILLLAATVNLPDSRFGVLYSGYGLFASVCALRYSYEPRRYLLFFAAPAVLAMTITLSGVVP